MIAKHLLLVCFTLSMVCCRKGDYPPDMPKPSDPKPVEASADIPSVKLKEMSVEKLPSPYYHFNYNDSGYITQVIYSSGLTTYYISYTGKKIQTIETNKDVPFDINKDKIVYEYTNGDATLIKVIDKNGIFYRKCTLSYLSSHQLQKLTWELNPGTGFVTEQTLVFSYYTDSNLKEIAYHDFAVGPQQDRTYTERFENYDNKVNPDGFTWLHTNQHHPVLLPTTRLQKNNPGRDIRTGAQVLTYEANYSYTYDAADRPLIKNGPVKFTEINGTTGQFESRTTFSYY